MVTSPLEDGTYSAESRRYKLESQSMIVVYSVLGCLVIPVATNTRDRRNSFFFLRSHSENPTS